MLEHAMNDGFCTLIFGSSVPPAIHLRMPMSDVIQQEATDSYHKYMVRSRELWSL